MASLDPVDISLARQQTLGIIMGGGAGTRLFPLTQKRSKPAVPLGGKYRLVDIPISNLINSGINHAYVLTQYNSTSLNRHISSAYKFDQFSNGFVEILAAQQTVEGNQWYQGTADAVRKNLQQFLRPQYKYFLILSGDQLYRMDFRRILTQHIQNDARITIATLPVDRHRATGFGILHSDESGRILKFVEKPKDPEILEGLRMPGPMLESMGLSADEERFQASMGIYVFDREMLVEALDNDLVDFGKHIIPAAIERYPVYSYNFRGYWEDIGTIGSFYQANLDLAQVEPKFDFYDRRAPIFTNARFLPASKVNNAHIERAIISDGCILSDVEIRNSIIGIRSIIERGSIIRDSVIMGADYFEPAGSPEIQSGLPPIGIGRGCRINRAIIDKNARIGNNVTLTPEGKPEEMDGENFYIRDGVVVVPKSAVIPDDTTI